MTRKTVHIISHSHWDREWYLPFESHRMRLVELFDDLFELFETDPEFKSFHLDGQTIVLDDYLAIRPQHRDKLKQYVSEGKLKVGPFYILQDDFLISSEANVRNTLIGKIESEQWGSDLKIGYFPDTFGNVGQIPQLLKQSDIDVALFGRGVKPIGFDNQVLSDEGFKSQFSEMNWVGADGSQVLGILFANWYSNGNEIPTDKTAAKVFWDKKLADVQKYASTSHLLMMNGCDHQPVQKDLTKAMAVARDLYPDFDFVHSDFETYIKAVQTELPDDLSHVYGELTSQETDGWYTLANTASARIYLKQANDKASKLLEQVVEPMIVMTDGVYPKDELRYAWKLLLENSPHDSICGCSVDEVHREMETRFAKVQQVGEFLADKAFKTWSDKLAISGHDGYHMTVMNTSGHTKTEVVECDILVDESDFRDGRLTEHYATMEAIELPTFGLFDSQGNQISADINDLGVSFDYHLPKDAFRSAVFARKVRVRFVAKDMAPFSWRTYHLKPTEQKETVQVTVNRLENDFVALGCEDNQLILTDKKRQRQLVDVMRFEDTGDIGNEYASFIPVGTQPIKADLIGFKVTVATQDYQKAELLHELHIPVSASDDLWDEQKRLVEYRHRQSQRSLVTKRLVLTTEVTLYQNSPQLHFTTSFVNEMKDHKLRVIFDTGMVTKDHLADSIYETVSRPNQPTVSWENQQNPQRHRSFISLDDDEQFAMVSSVGLHEYEVLDNRYVALTLLRSVGELGDWGDFPTPDAQCLRPASLDYAFEWQETSQFYPAIHRAKAKQAHLYSGQVYGGQGDVVLDGQLSHPVLDCPELCVTALKPLEAGEGEMIRYYNLSNDSLVIAHHLPQGLNLLEESIGQLDSEIGPQEIRTEVLV